jgi:hypothetical protein
MRFEFLTANIHLLFPAAIPAPTFPQRRNLDCASRERRCQVFVNDSDIPSWSIRRPGSGKPG